MRVNPAIRETQKEFFLLLEGIIQNNGVFFADNGQNSTSQTLVNLSLLNGYPDLYRVPILVPKANKSNGESSSPEPGDRVLVGFVGGDFNRPVIMGFLNMPGNTLQTPAADAPQYHHHWQGTDTRIGKDGSRTVHVAKDEILAIIGDGTVSIGGNLQITVTGNASISIDGSATIDTSTAHFTHDVTVGGKITAAGNIASTGGDVSDKVRSMAADRIIFDAHTHTSTVPGEPTSPPTTPE
jgi:phage gp45-like